MSRTDATKAHIKKKKIVRPRANKSKLSVNTTEESHTISLLSIQKDKYEKVTNQTHKFDFQNIN